MGMQLSPGGERRMERRESKRGERGERPLIFQDIREVSSLSLSEIGTRGWISNHSSSLLCFPSRSSFSFFSYDNTSEMRWRRGIYIKEDDQGILGWAHVLSSVVTLPPLQSFLFPVHKVSSVSPLFPLPSSTTSLTGNLLTEWEPLCYSWMQKHYKTPT